MKGRNCVITGGNSGIGYETALALACLDANIIILSRNQEKAEAAVKSIKARSQNNKIDYIFYLNPQSLANSSSSPNHSGSSSGILGALRSIADLSISKDGVA